MRLAEDGTAETSCFDTKFSGSPVSVALSSSPSVPTSKTSDRSLETVAIVPPSVPSVGNSVHGTAHLRIESKLDSAFKNTITDFPADEITPVLTGNSIPKSAGNQLSASGPTVNKSNNSQASARKPPSLSSASPAPRRNPMATVVMLNTLDSATDATKSRPSNQSTIAQCPSDPPVSKNVNANSTSHLQSTQVTPLVGNGQKRSDSSARPDSADASCGGGISSDSRPIVAVEHRKVRRKSVSQCCAIPKHLLPKWLPPSLLDHSIDPEADDDDLIERQQYLRVKTAEEMAAPLPIPIARLTPSSAAKARNGHAAGGSMTARARRADTRRANAEAQMRNNRAQQTAAQRQQPVRSNVNTRKRSRAVAQLECSAQENGRIKNSGTVKEEGVRRGERRSRDDMITGTSGKVNGRVTGPATKRSRVSTVPLNSVATGSSGANNGGRVCTGKSTVPRERFSKHDTKKGWLVCKVCEANVWPPNCIKHVANCGGSGQ